MERLRQDMVLYGLVSVSQLATAISVRTRSAALGSLIYALAIILRGPVVRALVSTIINHSPDGSSDDELLLDESEVLLALSSLNIRTFAVGSGFPLIPVMVTLFDATEISKSSSSIEKPGAVKLMANFFSSPLNIAIIEFFVG